jgi:hypothetical protein
MEDQQKTAQENAPTPDEQELKKDEITGGTAGAGNGRVTPHR